MPRSAAAILGLALVALSIGFNTVRYPMVWDMVGPARATEKEVSSSPRPKEPASHSPAPPSRKAPPPRTAEPIAVKPAPVAAKKSVEKPRPSAAKPDGGTAAQDKKPAAAEPKPEKQLVPVTQVSLASAPANGATIGTVIRRLPPVEPTDPNAANRANTLPAGGTIPVYPTTGIE